MLQYEGKNNVKHSAVTLTVVVNRTICENPKISLGMEIKRTYRYGYIKHYNRITGIYRGRRFCCGQCVA